MCLRLTGFELKTRRASVRKLKNPESRPTLSSGHFETINSVNGISIRHMCSKSRRSAGNNFVINGIYRVKFYWIRHVKSKCDFIVCLERLSVN